MTLNICLPGVDIYEEALDLLLDFNGNNLPHNLQLLKDNIMIIAEYYKYVLLKTYEMNNEY